MKSILHKIFGPFIDFLLEVKDRVTYFKISKYILESPVKNTIIQAKNGILQDILKYWGQGVAIVVFMTSPWADGEQSAMGKILDYILVVIYVLLFYATFKLLFNTSKSFIDFVKLNLVVNGFSAPILGLSSIVTIIAAKYYNSSTPLMMIGSAVGWIFIIYSFNVYRAFFQIRKTKLILSLLLVSILVFPMGIFKERMKCKLGLKPTMVLPANSDIGAKLMDYMYCNDEINSIENQKNILINDTWRYSEETINKLSNEDDYNYLNDSTATTKSDKKSDFANRRVHFTKTHLLIINFISGDTIMYNKYDISGSVFTIIEQDSALTSTKWIIQKLNPDIIELIDNNSLADADKRQKLKFVKNR